MENLSIILKRVLLYFIILFQIYPFTNSETCNHHLHTDTWLEDDGSIAVTIEEPRILWEPCPSNQDTSDGIEFTGKCVLCVSAMRIVACVGSHVTHLPSPEELPPVVDIYQVKNSDVRIINANSFYNKTVKEIYIEHNEIHVMSQLAFMEVNGLKFLSLLNNNLPYFYTSTVEHLLELDTLILDDNGFEFSGTGDFVKSDTSSDKSSLNRRNIRAQTHNELSLRVFSIAKNPLKTVPKYAFTWLTNSRVSYLSLRGCSIQSAHKDALLPLQRSLLDLDLSDVIDIAPILFNLTSGLKEGCLQHLSLSSSGMVRLPHAALTNVAHTLVGLTLQGNNFQKLRKDEFPYMPHLETLDLRRSSIINLDNEAFNGLPSLSSLYLSGNRFAVIYNPFHQLINLIYLDMSGNPDPIFIESNADYTLQENAFEGLCNLTTLNLSNSKIQKLRDIHFAYLINLKNLSLYNTVIWNVGETVFKNSSTLETLHLSGTTSITKHLDNDIFFGLISLQNLFITDGDLEFTKESSDYFRYLYTVKNLILKSNKIRIIFENSLASLHQLEYINLDGNKLESWQKPIFFHNRFLEKISLKNNHISYITDVMLEEFRRLSHLVLHDNPLQCDCNMERFVLEIATNSNTTVENWNKKSNPLRCYDPITKTSIDLVNLPNFTMCAFIEETIPTEEITVDNTISFAVLIVCGFVALLLVIFISVIVYRKRNNLRYLALMVKSTMAAALMEDQELEDEIVTYIYDVFVSYCEADRDWVIDHLLPSLERDAQLRVCLHERDFEPGYGILDNIINCIDKSNSLLFVVSKKSLKSQWCKFEMHLAQHRFVETNRDKFILVLMSNIPKLQRPRTLHYLMATRTYLVWDPQREAIFWRRLKKTLMLNTNRTSKV